MIRFDRAQAAAYLTAMAVWVAGFVVVALLSVGGQASASGVAVGVLLLCLFAACGSIGVIAWKVTREDAPRRTNPLLAGGGDGPRWLALCGLLWVLLLCGVGLPAAFKAVNANR